VGGEQALASILAFGKRGGTNAGLLRVVSTVHQPSASPGPVPSHLQISRPAPSQPSQSPGLIHTRQPTLKQQPTKTGRATRPALQPGAKWALGLQQIAVSTASAAPEPALPADGC